MASCFTLESVIAAIATAGIAAGASLLGYNCFAPTSQLYGPTLSDCPHPDQIALTYDDGPNDIYTQRLLELLSEHQVRATFFLIGNFVRARPQIARAIAHAGHAVGNHTHTHPNLLFLSSRAIRQQLSDSSKALSDVLGVQTKWFRPPFGARRPEALKVARELGLTPVMWNVTGFDWKASSAAVIDAYVRKKIDGERARGHIVLLHDGGHTQIGADRSQTIEATKLLIQRYKESHRFVTVDQI
jgi:peptidoglycan/xylan/chitin deacetylase (PgdA/CDA1 family)